MKYLTISAAVLGFVADAEVMPLFGLGASTQSKKTPIFDGGEVEEIVLHGGVQEGTLLLKLTTKDLQLYVSPSRGMSIMNMTALTTDPMTLGWSNPIKEVVNPAHVNLMERDGDGFLTGFNEMLARCGYQWAGHTGKDGDDLLTLHGLAANTPARDITLEEKDGEVTIRGDLMLKTFKKSHFKVQTKLIIYPSGHMIRLEDTLRNEGSYEEEYMAIYHANFGPPILQKDSKVYAPASHVSPFNLEAVPLLDDWDVMLDPTEGYDETVYNLKTYADDTNWTAAMMTNAAEDRAISVRWRLTELPVFGLWKNLDTEATGYVVGLEPGTSFSYNRRWNREIGLVPKLKPSESVTFVTEFEALTTAAAVALRKNDIAAILADRATEVLREPLTRQSEPTRDAANSFVAFASLAGIVLGYLSI